MVQDKHILLVDDDPAIRMLWERFLERWGYGYALAADGSEALQRARETHFRLLVTDLVMPGMGGLELIKQVKDEQPELEIIVITGNGTIEVAVEAMKAGAYEFITKPINFHHAELVIHKCLSQAEAREENVRLREVNRQLEALNEMKEKFIAITNHELRTPVSVINNIVEILEAELREGPAGSLVGMLRHSARHLTEIVAQMHELSRAKSDRLSVVCEHFALHPLCEEVRDELSLSVQRRGHEIVCNISPKLSVWADRVKFKKVVRELIQNAIKFTPDGGRIQVDAWMDDAQRFCFRVKDTGIGIAEQNQDRIFQLFYEVGESTHHHTSKDEFLGGGMGVGLSLVKDIVEAHRGTVRVESRLGQGSTFTLTLPQDVSGGAGVSRQAIG